MLMNKVKQKTSGLVKSYHESQSPLLHTGNSLKQPFTYQIAEQALACTSASFVIYVQSSASKI